MPAIATAKALLVGLMLMACASPAILAQDAAPHPAQALRDGDHVAGAQDASLVMIEYASFACGHCAHFQQDVWPTIESEFVDAGRVRWVLRPMLTQPVQLAGAGIILAECAAEERYFEAADLLFTEQAAIFETAQAGGDVLAVYNRIAAAVGLSPDDFMACLNDPAMNQLVNEAAEQASEDGIQGTPTFIVGGKILTTANLGDGYYFTWGGEPLLINADRVPGQLDGDTFRRIVLHFLEVADSGD